MPWFNNECGMVLLDLTQLGGGCGGKEQVSLVTTLSWKQGRSLLCQAGEARNILLIVTGTQLQSP